MLRKILIFVFILVVLDRVVEAKFSDFLDIITFPNSELEENLTLRERREADDSESTNKTKADLIKFANVILHVADNNVNVSIIGTQNIYDSHGRITKVNSIELAFPLKDISKTENFLGDDNEDEFIRSMQHEFVKHFDKIYESNKQKRGFETFHVFLETSEDKKPPNRLYFTPNTTYFRIDGLVTFNKTQTATTEEVEDFFKKIKSNKMDFYLAPLFVQYNSEDELQNVDGRGPSAVSYVVDSWNAPDEVLLDGPRIMSDIAIAYDKDEIPQQLATEFNNQFQDYEWRVLVNPGRFNIIKDAWIKLSTDGYEFYEGEKDIYLVYGILKSN